MTEREWGKLLFYVEDGESGYLHSVHHRRGRLSVEMFLFGFDTTIYYLTDINEVSP